MKRICQSLSILLICLLVFQIYPIKAEPKTVTVELTIGNNVPIVNGESIIPLESEIFIENGRTFVPIRLPSEVFHINTTWEGKTKTATFTNDKNILIEMKIDSATAKVNGKDVPIDSPPIIRSNRSQVSIRFIMETFGATVTWDPDLHKVTIVHEIPEEQGEKTSEK